MTYQRVRIPREDRLFKIRMRRAKITEEMRDADRRRSRSVMRRKAWYGEHAKVENAETVEDAERIRAAIYKRKRKSC